MSRPPDAVLHDLQTRGIKLGLDKVRTLLLRLDAVACAPRAVQVAGTNGKGSVAYGLEAVARAAGLRTGLFTSPHLVSPTERVRVDGVDLEQAELDRRVVALDERLARWSRDDPELAHVTYFEFFFALAAEAFRDAGVDLAILEVGMGGRLDATTAADAGVTVITSIARDHEEYLGRGLAAIAAEKAGVARPGVPLLVGPLPDEADRVIRAHAREVGAPLRPIVARDGVRNGMWGRHQRINAALALAAAAAVGIEEGPETLAALAATRVPARCESFPGTPEVVLDGAHNPAATAALAAALADHPAAGATELLTSVGRDKDLRGVLAPLIPGTRRVHVTAYRGGRTPAPAEAVAEAVRALGGAAVVHADAAAALMAARATAAPGDRLLVAGSLFLAGELRALLLTEGAG